MKKNISNIKQLRDDLLNVYQDLRKGEISTSEVKEAVNAAGKIVSTCKVQLDYAKLRGDVPEIPFLDAQ